MRQLLLSILLIIFFSFNNYAQSTKIACPRISSEATASKILKLENPKDYPTDSIIFQLPDIFPKKKDYIYLINRTKEYLFFKSTSNFVPDVIQEALDTNGNWIPIESIITANDCMPPSLDYIKPNQYVAFSKSFYIEGNFCTKIRFKVIGPYQNYYSQPYDGCIDSCLILPYVRHKSELIKIYQSKKSNEEKIKWVKDNWKEEKAIRYTTVLIRLYRKSDDFASASLYIDQLIKLTPNSGRGYLYKGDLYAQSTRKCFPDNMFLQKAIINLAFEEWKKAKQYKDVREDVEKRYRSYSKFVLSKEDYPQLTFTKNKTIHIGCWINKTITIK